MKLTFEYSRKVNRMWEDGYAIYQDTHDTDTFLLKRKEGWMLASDDLVYFTADEVEQISEKLKELNANDK